MPAEPLEHYEIGFLASRSPAKMLALNALFGFLARLGLANDSTIP